MDLPSLRPETREVLSALCGSFLLLLLMLDIRL
nr:MAG TPA: hypothetical protein [Caudoviricetes sp.]